jgi:hypothetical protein
MAGGFNGHQIRNECGGVGGGKFVQNNRNKVEAQRERATSAWETRSAEEEVVEEREWRVENVGKEEARIMFWRSVPCLVHMYKPI